MAYFLSPLFNDAQLDNNGNPLSGGKVYWYQNRTTTPQPTYADQLGSALQPNPVILNTRGEPYYPIWLEEGLTYTAVLRDASDSVVRPPVYDISGINDVPDPVTDEWLLFAANATYISDTSFSVIGDQTAVFNVNRRVKIPVIGGNNYGTVATSTYSSVLNKTTIVIVNDSLVLDFSISTVYYGFTNPAYPSSNPNFISSALKASIQNQAFTAITATGTVGAFVATANPAITSYIDGQRFRVRFAGTSGATITLSINGLPAKPIRYLNALGLYTTLSTGDISNDMYGDVEYSVLINGFIIHNPKPVNMADYVSLAIPQNITSVKTFNSSYEPISKNICKAWATFDGVTSASLGYTVTSQFCTVSEAAHQKRIGSIVWLQSTGVLVPGAYVVTSIAANSFAVACPGTADGSGSLTIPCWIKEHFNIASIQKFANGDYLFSFATAMLNSNYAVFGTTCGTSGSVSVAGVAVSGPGLKTNNQCEIYTTNSSGVQTAYKEAYIQFLGT